VPLLKHTETGNGSAKLPIVRRLAIVAVALVVAGCSSDDGGKPPTGPDPLLDGGKPAFDAFIGKQRGKPVVVNKWASWCGPCRVETPWFQRLSARLGKRIAFLGVNSKDSSAAAKEFVREFPLPYPSFSDPDEEIAEAMEATIGFPATAFYDSSGELAHVQQGQYASIDALAADIERYAR
jgi:cytochrome c biogenesis protein CcmG, thiol:disulfide interchange protein DsbE